MRTGGGGGGGGGGEVVARGEEGGRGDEGLTDHTHTGLMDERLDAFACTKGEWLSAEAVAGAPRARASPECVVVLFFPQ